MAVPSSGLETVFVLGAGANRNGWEPVLSAIDDLCPELEIGKDVSTANTYFARHVYHRKFVARFQEALALDPSLEQRLRQHDAELKRAIAARLHEATASGEMTLRPELVALLREPRWGKSAFVTANWDLCLERAGIPDEAIVHVHGDLRQPALLFLPTEITGELHQSDEELEALNRGIRRAWECIAMARRLVLYGLSLSALDAELGHLITMGLSEHREAPCDVFVYNVEDELHRIRRRAEMFLEKQAKIRFHLVPVR